MDFVRVARLSRRGVSFALAVIWAASNFDASASEVQTILLRQGWNAISVQIEPTNRSPGAVFANLPIDKAAAYFPARTPVEFIQDPVSQPWKQKGWRAWFASDLPESAINDLYAINAGQCYLVHATAPATLRVTGTIVNHRTRWHADSFNFVGFAVDPAAPPTFQNWFAGSSAHQSAAKPMVYTLGANDAWRPVDHPETTPILPNAAYWVFCNGASDYQGPLDVSFPTAGLNQGDFGDLTESITIKASNNLPTPLGVVAQLSPADALPILYQVALRSLGEKLQVPFTESATFGPIEPGASTTFRLSLNRASMTQPSGSAVLTIRDDVGTLIRIPVTGRLP